ncbi:pancreatic secretory granule membrane major glycoprotein GP2 isoform X3 [Ictalurus furcatus]|uniref:pancreatic secretory granule membrane major glycoprotein GP2 isoform X3 n=1 Tax=Ictalurus furcatus TaxID=66913 RepID=UPI0023501414|nr:pancreatic secretory granule membrane major glycoprotein GP2 isoform X3 [Ictalurus furcatus]
MGCMILPCLAALLFFSGVVTVHATTTTVETTAEETTTEETTITTTTMATTTLPTTTEMSTIEMSTIEVTTTEEPTTTTTMATATLPTTTEVTTTEEPTTTTTTMATATLPTTTVVTTTEMSTTEETTTEMSTTEEPTTTTMATATLPTTTEMTTTVVTTTEETTTEEPTTTTMATATLPTTTEMTTTVVTTTEETTTEMSTIEEPTTTTMATTTLPTTIEVTTTEETTTEMSTIEEPTTTTTMATATLPTTTEMTTTEETTTPAPCQILNCVSDEVCKKINGVYGCGCGYFTTDSPNIYDAIETCSGSNGSLSLSRCELFEAGYSADVLHLNDPNCKGELQNNRLVFSFDSNVNMCGTTLENNSTHIVFKNSVGTTDLTGVISRTGGLNITFSCVYPLIQSISMPTAIEGIGGIISKYLSTEGSYQISMIPYTDATFQFPLFGNVTLEVNHQMYIAVQVDQFDSTQIGLVLDSCWATPFNQTDYYIRWDLISNECPNPNDGTVAVLQNGVSTTSYFSFRMFTFTGFSNKIYLHCQVHLCLLQTGNCAQMCTGNPSRRRRAVDFYDSAAITMEF